LTSDKSNSNRNKKYFGVVFTIILAFAFLYFAFRNVDFAETLKNIKNLSIGWFLLYIVFFYLSHFLRAARWQVMIKSVKEKTSILNLFGAVMIGYGVNVAVPRLGEIYRGLFLGKWEGISRTSMLGSIILERFIDIFAFTIGALICVYVYTGNLFERITWFNQALMIGFILILAFILFLVSIILFKEKFIKLILKVTSKISVKLSSRVESFFDTLIIGFSSIKDTKGYLLTGLYSVLILFCYALSSYAVFYSLGMEKGSEVSFGMAWVYMIISAFGVIIPTPGGFGSYHAVAIFVLTTLYGFSNEVGAAFALLTHTAQVILFIFTALFFFNVINNRNARKGMMKEDFISVFRSQREAEK
jgi:glycosyltransferase 2 family protein